MRLFLSVFGLAASVATFAVAACPTPTATDHAEIYPTAEVLPSNLLRAYVYFPRRMWPEDTLKHVALLDAAGTEVSGAFLETRYNLWSPDRRRLTLLFDPGRVKTGLAAHEQLGRALNEGEDYSLVVRGTARDAEGCMLGADVVHKFVAGPVDITPPDPQSWQVTLPDLGTTAPLSVHLIDPHDHLSMAFRLRVVDADGNLTAGTIDLAEGERIWRFTPHAPWIAQEYRIAVDPRLEDLAGNRPGILFDRPIAQDEVKKDLTLYFRPKDAEQ